MAWCDNNPEGLISNFEIKKMMHNIYTVFTLGRNIIPVLEIKVMMHDTKKHCIMVSSIFN